MMKPKLFRSTTVRRVVRLAMTLVVALLGNTALHAQNLLLNPNFSGGTLAPWSPGFTVFDPQSASADGSGSAAGTFTGTNGVLTSIRQCVTGIVPGSYYNLTGKILIPSGQASAGSTRLVVTWTNNPACLSFISDDFSNSLAIPGTPTDAWLPVQGGGIAPPGAQGASIQGLVYKSGAAVSSLQVNFDELAFQLAPVGNFVLAVTRSGAGFGSVTGTNISCGGTENDCTESLAPGSTIVLTATPNPISAFTAWSGGGCSGAVPTCTVTMSAARTVNAQFALAPTVALNVIFSGTGSGSVAFSSDDNSCTASCTLQAVQNSTTVLTATPSPGSTFVGFSGGGCAGAAPCSVAMNVAQSVTAQFSSGAGATSIPTLNPGVLVLLAALVGMSALVKAHKARR